MLQDFLVRVDRHFFGTRRVCFGWTCFGFDRNFGSTKNRKSFGTDRRWGEFEPDWRLPYLAAGPDKNRHEEKNSDRGKIKLFGAAENDSEPERVERCFAARTADESSRLVESLKSVNLRMHRLSYQSWTVDEVGGVWGENSFVMKGKASEWPISVVLTLSRTLTHANARTEVTHARQLQMMMMMMMMMWESSELSATGTSRSGSRGPQWAWCACVRSCCLWLSAYLAQHRSLQWTVKQRRVRLLRPPAFRAAIRRSMIFPTIQGKFAASYGR